MAALFAGRASGGLQRMGRVDPRGVLAAAQDLAGSVQEVAPGTSTAGGAGGDG